MSSIDNSCEEQVLRLEAGHRSSIVSLTQWVSDSTMDVYARVSWRFIGDRRVTSLEIGSVEVRRGERGKGRFTQFLEALEKGSTREVLYVENVLQPRFQQFFRSRSDYMEVSSEGPPSFVRWIGK